MALSTRRLLSVLPGHLQDAMAEIIGIDPGGVAGQLVIAAGFEKPLQRILPLGSALFGVRCYRGGADRVLERPLYHCAPQLTLGKSAAAHDNWRCTSRQCRSGTMPDADWRPPSCLAGRARCHSS